MALQLALSVLTVASPICCYDGICPRKGRAVYGKPFLSGRAINRSIWCLTCRREGEESVAQPSLVESRS